jgi:cupin superfamily acireductone dioxygenase involved in methionine salvage
LQVDKSRDAQVQTNLQAAEVSVEELKSRLTATFDTQQDRHVQEAGYVRLDVLVNAANHPSVNPLLEKHPAWISNTYTSSHNRAR